jgi:hypothetical protein
MLVARVAQLERQVAVVGQQQQAFAVQVQPAHGVEAYWPLEQRLQPWTAARVVEDRQHAGRLIEHEIGTTGLELGLEQVAVDTNLIALRIDLDPQHVDHLAVDRHPAGLDHLVTGAPRGDPRVGHHLVQSFLRHARS